MREFPQNNLVGGLNQSASNNSLLNRFKSRNKSMIVKGNDELDNTNLKPIPSMISLNNGEIPTKKQRMD